MTVGSQVKNCYATIKQIEATLENLSYKTQDALAKEKFQETKKIIEEIKNDLQEQIIHITREEPQYKV